MILGIRHRPEGPLKPADFADHARRFADEVIAKL
jgi:hypothetical protein